MPNISWFPKKPPTNVDEANSFSWYAWYKSIWRALQGITRTYNPALTAATTLSEDNFYLVDSSSGAVTITLPLASTYQYKCYTIKKVGTGTNAITFALSGSDIIDNSLAPVLLERNDSITFHSDGVSTWWVEGKFYPVRVADGSATAQAAALAATTVYAVPAAGAGWYRINCNVGVTQAATTSSVAGPVQATYTDPVDSVAKTTPTGAFAQSTVNTTAAGLAVALTVYCKASTNLQLAIGYTSVGGTAMQYDYKYTVEFLGA